MGMEKRRVAITVFDPEGGEGTFVGDGTVEITDTYEKQEGGPKIRRRWIEVRLILPGDGTILNTES